MKIIQILTKKYPGTQWSMNGDTYDGLIWHDESISKPTEAELTALWPEVKQELDLAPIRAQRDALLDEVDLKHCNAEKWVSMTAAKQQEWATYKQALRDLPSTIDLANPIWPTMPTS